MRSIGARLTLIYAIAATGSAAILFGSGYVLLQRMLVKGLDDLNRIEFVQLRREMGPDFRTLTPKQIDERIRATANAAPAIFYIDVEIPNSGMLFYSDNLHRQSIPDVNGQHIYNAPIPGGGDARVGEFIMPPFEVTIATPMAQTRAAMRNYAMISALLLLTMLIASAVIGLGVSRVMLRPLEMIRATAMRISSDNLSERIAVAGQDDELAELAALLNRMFDRLERSFEQIKQFAAEASHELKTPISLIRLHGERLLERTELSPEAEEGIVVQLEEVGRLNQIIEDMLFISRAEANAVPLAVEVVDPVMFLQNFAQDAQALAEHDGRSFRLETAGSGPVVVQERWIRRVFLNVLTNALAASEPGGAVTMASHVAEGSWRVTFRDEGQGLRADELPRIFDRFTQFGPTERRARGSGLGLAISRAILHLHGGTIAAFNRADRPGLEVTITIPPRHIIAG